MVCVDLWSLNLYVGLFNNAQNLLLSFSLTGQQFSLTSACSMLPLPDTEIDTQGFLNIAPVDTQGILNIAPVAKTHQFLCAFLDS